VGVGLPWLDVNVTGGADGDVVLEMYNDIRKLTIYIEPDRHVEYLKSWGMDMASEMDDGDVHSIEDCIDLWKWLTVVSPHQTQPL
jgi:hypothetical protein